MIQDKGGIYAWLLSNGHCDMVVLLRGICEKDTKDPRFASENTQQKFVMTYFRVGDSIMSRHQSVLSGFGLSNFGPSL